jgi:hypothetical protein
MVQRYLDVTPDCGIIIAQVQGIARIIDANKGGVVSDKYVFLLGFPQDSSGSRLRIFPKVFDVWDSHDVQGLQRFLKLFGVRARHYPELNAVFQVAPGAIVKVAIRRSGNERRPSVRIAELLARPPQAQTQLQGEVVPS